jgi:glycosyltransferase involved in cell wall biosynthesis
MSWGSDVLEAGSAARRRAVFALRRSDALVSDCDAVTEKVRSWLSYPNERVVQFPWGVELKTFRPGPARLGLRRRPGWKDATILLSTRTWEPLYGTMTLLEGFALARRKNPKLKLVMLGDGSLGARVRRFVAAHKLRAHVLLPGRVAHDRLRDWFRSADVYVSASRSDGSSVSLLEAMACALPAIVTDIPGNREWIPSARHGLRYPPGNARALSARILALAPEGKRRAGMGRANLAKARRDADWDKNFERLLTAYEKLA